jgi:hypothetical protein
MWRISESVKTTPFHGIQSKGRLKVRKEGVNAKWKRKNEGGDTEQGNKEQGTRNKEQGTRNKEQGTRNKEQGASPFQLEVPLNTNKKYVHNLNASTRSA